ncbi:MAG: type VI secretion system tip protein VgrG [Bacteroidota bacterium]
MAEKQTISTSQTADSVTFTVLINGEAIPSEIGVQSVSIWLELNRIPKAKLMIIDGIASDNDFAISAQDFFVPGNEIEIQAGYHSDEEPIYKGIITKHSIRMRSEGGSHLIVDCSHSVVKATQIKKSRYFYESLEGDIWSSILSDYGLEADVTATEYTFNELLQFQCTDWDFLVTRAEIYGFFVNVDKDEIKIGPPDFEQEVSEAVNFGSTLLSFDAEIDSSHQLGSVIARSWDYSKTEATEIEAKSSNPKTPGNFNFSDLQSVFGNDPLIIDSVSKQPDEILQKWADSTLLRHELAKVRGRAQFIGIPQVIPGKLIELQGLGDRFNGEALVSGVRHNITGGKWLMDVQFGMARESFAERFEINAKPAYGLTPTVHGLQIGVVTQIEGDPEGDDRIQVILPMVESDGQGVWARMSTFGAGGSRGIVVRPEIGDEVVVGCVNNDPNSPIILGALNSSNLPSPIPPSDDNYEKGWVTKGEMKMIIDDDKQSLNVEMPSGKQLLISDGDSVIELKDENGNSITLNSDGITIESAKDIILKTSAGDINISGNNVNSESQIATKITANATAELSSSGSTTIKGGIVQIN